MSGFPARSSRSAFGPVPKNRYPVTNPEKQLDAEIGDLLFWQTAGMNAVSDRAFVVFDASANKLSHGEAWDPDRNGVGPTVTHSGTGVYQVVYPATVPDKDGNLVAPALVAAKAYPQPTSLVNRKAVQYLHTDGRTIDIQVFDGTGASVDCPVLLEVK